MTAKRSLLVVGCLLATACTPEIPLLRPDTEEGPIVFTQMLMQHTSASLDRLTARIDIADKRETVEYRYWKNFWCPRAPTVQNADQVRGAIAAYCHAHGGVYDQGVACVIPGDAPNVLFYERITDEYHCSGLPSANAEIIEPKPGMMTAPGYIAALSTVGYVPTAIRVVQNAQAQAREQERVTRELPRLSTRGTKICRHDGPFTYVGFVDDINADRSKIRILVNGTTNGIAPGGWQPGPLWDVPGNWYVCE